MKELIAIDICTKPIVKPKRTPYACLYLTMNSNSETYLHVDSLIIIMHYFWVTITMKLIA